MSDIVDLPDYCSDVARSARAASRALVDITTEQKNQWLNSAAGRLREEQPALLVANEADVTASRTMGLDDAQLDRLRLTSERIESLARGLEQVAELPDPVGQVLNSRSRPNGLTIDKVRVPLGVVFFIYESRPNVTADAAAICVKSGNAVILRGGKEAAHSSQAIVRLLRTEAEQAGLPVDCLQLVATSDRDAVGHFLCLPEYIDLAIPRGGEGLIRRVVAEAKMPVLKHFSGNCHVYVDQSADLKMARQIVVNSKCQRMGVCNATESLLVHESIAADILPPLVEELATFPIEVRGDQSVRQLVPTAIPLTEDDLSTEYLGPILSACVVDDVEQAITHINRYGSGHTDAIVANDPAAIERFERAVDSSAVIVNASTRFNDGGEFGLGAEIGISTDKFHARGPCGLEELTTYKYIVRGTGQLRG